MGKKMKIEGNKKREKLKLFGSSADFGTTLKGSRIEIFSNSEVIVEGCLGVYEYNDNYLKLRLMDGALVIIGETFDIISFGDKTIVVKGKISSLEFCV